MRAVVTAAGAARGFHRRWSVCCGGCGAHGDDDGISLSHDVRVRSLIFLVFPEEVSCPVDEVEEGEHERKEDARDDIDAFGSCGKLGKPGFT